MEINWTDRVRSKEVLQTVNEDRNILQTIKFRKANWIGHVLGKNCLLKHVIKGKIEGRIEATERRGKKVSSYWMTLKKYRILEIERGITLSRIRFGRGYGAVV